MRALIGILFIAYSSIFGLPALADETTNAPPIKRSANIETPPQPIRPKDATGEPYKLYGVIEELAGIYGYHGGSVLQRAAKECGAEIHLILREANIVVFPGTEVVLSNWTLGLSIPPELVTDKDQSVKATKMLAEALSNTNKVALVDARGNTFRFKNAPVVAEHEVVVHFLLEGKASLPVTLALPWGKIELPGPDNLKSTEKKK